MTVSRALGVMKRVRIIRGEIGNQSRRFLA
jgi:hypothetical protein